MTTRKIKRSKQYEITLEIKEDTFINPPRESQRNTILNQAVKEFGDDLDALDKLAADFVPGAFELSVVSDRTQADLTEEQIMEDWQIPVMQAMSNVVCESRGDILEIGFGRGISSSMIQQNGVRSHTIIECNNLIIDKFHLWKNSQQNQEIHLIKGLWQDTIEDLGLFDGIFFHTYPLNEEEYMKYVHGRVTFAEHFFAVAAEHLKAGGVFTYFSNEMDSISRGHQRGLFKHFTEVSASLVSLEIPENIADTWWSNSMVIIKAKK
jgi:guanidinoacetate N-methyltransferase